jgi:valyl-tRNA synthetase
LKDRLLAEPLPKTYDPAWVETRWYAFWESKGYFRALDRSDAAPYCIVIPPPNVTGSLHCGHALTNAIQDVLVRHKRMQGKNALWLPGTDHAGIATQVVVERELAKEGISRHELGREKFIERTWKWKEEYGGRITKQLRFLGSSLDWARERFTMDDAYSRAVREEFVRLFEEGLAYRATRLVNWCPKDRTVLSDLEVEHEEGATGELFSFAYPLADGSGEIVVATTRPETMLGDTAVAVHPDDERYRALVGKEVRHPILGRTFAIIADGILVDPAFGTGAVKVTPAHDWSDFETGKRHELAEINILELDGRLNAAAGPFAGLDRFEARRRVKEALAEAGLERGTKPHVLALGRCQRCNDIVEPMISTQWFVRMKPLAEPAMAAVRDGRTRFVPEEWSKTYFHWLENIQDWCISRQLWWGHQVPAWYCPDGHVTVAREDPPACGTCGRTDIGRDPDVFDTWFSSGLWPFATLGWPEKTPALQTFYPTSDLETGFDIIFFWVARMMMMGLHFMGDVPFRRVLLHGMVTDERGHKMTKSRGNVIDPLDVIQGTPDGKYEAQGADALRMTLASYSPQGRKIALSLKRVEGYRHFCNKIWNATKFALPLLEGAPAATEGTVPPATSLADRWILDRLAVVSEAVNVGLDEFRLDEATGAIYQFFWTELCDWYLEASKPILYGDDASAKSATQAVLRHVLDASLRLLHPVMPFVTEELWQRIPHANGSADALIIARFPDASWGRRDAGAAADMTALQSAVRAVRALRAETGLSPATEVEVSLWADDAETRRALSHSLALAGKLCRAKRFTLADTPERPRGSAVAVDSGVTAHVSLRGLVDPKAERARIEKEIGKVEKDVLSVQKKLENKSFVDRAPTDVVEKERGRQAENLAALERLRGALAVVDELDA